MSQEDFISLVRLLVEVSDLCRLNYKLNPALGPIWDAAETSLAQLNTFDVPKPKVDIFDQLFEVE